jgi:hypothetical protein
MWITKRVAKCEECGFEWIPRKKKEPLRCASNKCQSRMWNNKGSAQNVKGKTTRTRKKVRPKHPSTLVA